MCITHMFLGIPSPTTDSRSRTPRTNSSITPTVRGKSSRVEHADWCVVDDCLLAEMNREAGSAAQRRIEEERMRLREVRDGAR